MFSITTIASSTRMPMASESPSNDIRLSEYPNKFIITNVLTMEVGIEINTMAALRRLCKKSSMTSPTKSTAMSRSSITALVAFLVNVLLLATTSKRIPSVAYTPCSIAIFSSTSFDISTALASPCLRILMPTEGCPSVRQMISASRVPSWISAMSFKKMDEPKRLLPTTRLRMSSMPRNLPARRIRSWPCSPVTFPVGKSRLAVCTA